MIVEPNRRKKDFLFLPARAQLVRDCHNSANEKPLYFKLSIPPMDSLFTIALPILKVLISLLYRYFHKTNPNCNSLLIRINPFFGGEITGSVFVLDQYFVRHVFCFFSVSSMISKISYTWSAIFTSLKIINTFRKCAFREYSEILIYSYELTVTLQY